MLRLSVISLIQTIGVEGMLLVSAIEIVSCALAAVGPYLSFTGNARGWFNGEAENEGPRGTMRDGGDPCSA
jgi:hypothetical protein